MLFANGDGMPKGIRGSIAKKDSIVCLRKNKFFRKFEHLMMRSHWYCNAEKMQKKLIQLNAQNLFLSHPLSDYKNIAHHPLVKWADIIHLHWVPGFVDYSTFFRRVRKPIVWTIHDKYPAVGVLHYCSEHYPIPDNLYEFDQLCRKIKRKGVLQSKSLHLVAISAQMASLFAESDVLKGLPTTIIHNGVETDVYYPNDLVKKDFLNKYLSVPIDFENKKILMFSSYEIWDYNKGLRRVIKAIESLKIPNVILVVVGRNELCEMPVASFPIILTGLLTDQIEIVKLYSIADLFIQASYEESFGQTLLEAMACGCPVVSTSVGVAPELIKPFNGIICDGFDENALAHGIKSALSTFYDSTIIRSHIVENFSYDKIAKEYICLYSEILQ